MTSVDSEKAFEYLKIQEGSRSENLTGIIYVKEYFCFSLSWKIYKHEIKRIIQ